MHEEMKKSLTHCGLDDEDVEFYSYGLLAMLKREQVAKQIPSPVFRRKFSAMFRLYGPLIEELYSKPVQLANIYLLWENNFFRKVALVHHRDQARSENMQDIVEMWDSNRDELQEIILERADKLADRLHKQRVRAEQVKAKKKQKAASKPKTPTFQMDDEQGQQVLTCSLHLRGLSRELDETINAAAVEVNRTCDQNEVMPVHEDQHQTRNAILRLAAGTQFLLKKAQSAGLSPADLVESAEDKAPIGNIDSAWTREFSHLRNLTTLQLQCVYMEGQECKLALEAARFGTTLAIRQVHSLLAIDKTIACQADAEAYVKTLTSWVSLLEKERDDIAQDWSMLKEEKLLIERKEKFASYIQAVKSKKVSLGGELDELFKV